MPPKAKITREMILNAVLEITREAGFEAVNARSVAGRLSCSTRPVFTCYKNMEELKVDFLAYAFAYYTRYVEAYEKRGSVKPFLILPLSYIDFAREETELFKLLFIRDMELSMAEAKDFYREIGNARKAELFAEQIGVEPERGREIFLDLFFYSHGLAVLAADGQLALKRDETETRLLRVLSALAGKTFALD